MEPTNLNLAINDNPLKQEKSPVVEKILSKLRNDLGSNIALLQMSLAFPHDTARDRDKFINHLREKFNEDLEGTKTLLLNGLEECRLVLCQRNITKIWEDR